MAIKQGIAADGGLLVPDQIPQISLEDIARMQTQSYQQRAVTILSLYLTDYTRQELEDAVAAAYTEEKVS
jgi:threonine synthase